MIRIGRIIYNPYPKAVKPSLENFETIEVMTKSSKYGELSPYCLTDEKGVLMENKWQFSKIYEEVPDIVVHKNYYDKTIVWSGNKERHVKQLNSDEYGITNEYWKWRNKGFSCEHPIRYPVGKNYSKKCMGAISTIPSETDEVELLGYIDARKKIYLPEYVKLVKKHPTFKKLKEKLKKGINLLIIEVDGPHQESLSYYIEKYNVGKDFISDNTMLATKENLEIMLNDSRHPFGHGYCLAIALMENLKLIF